MHSYKLLIGGYDGQIHTVQFDPHSRQGPSLEITSTTACGAAPTWLTLSEDGKTVYSLDEWGQPGEVTAMSVDEIGQLTKLSSVTTGGLWPCHSSLLSRVSPQRLVATNYKGASLSSIPLHASGDIDLTSEAFERIDFLGTRTPGPHRERQQQDHPHGAHVDPHHLVVVVPDLGTDDLRVLGIKPDGTLEEFMDPIELAPGSGPRHVLFSTSGERLYVMNELDNSVTTFAVEYPSTAASLLSKAGLSTSATALSSASAASDRYPSFTLLQSNVSLLPAEPFPHQSSFASWHSAELALSPSGQTLYASNRAEGHNPLHPPKSDRSDLVAVFPLDADGTLVEADRTLVEVGGRCPRHFSLSRRGGPGGETAGGPGADDEGRWMAVVCHDSDELIVFERVGEDGRELREVARLEECGKPAIAVWL
ncbi:hypothetical protein JCM11491_005223 [Sporobolomyces phaffii]